MYVLHFFTTLYIYLNIVFFCNIYYNCYIIILFIICNINDSILKEGMNMLINMAKFVTNTHDFHINKKCTLALILSSGMLLFTACGNKYTVSTENELIKVTEVDYSEIENTNIETLSEEDVPKAIIGTDGLRDNTPVCYVPTPGNTTYSNALATLDVSNSSQGYIMLKYTGTNPKAKLRITGENGVTYTYNLHGGYETFPLSAGNGTYKIAVYENVTGNKYSTALSQSISVNMTNPFGPFLYPNQYVDFNSDSLVVAKAQQLTENCTSDLDAVTKIYNFATTLRYDHTKANNVQSGYTSNVDEIMTCGTGICLDYAAVMASMLRSQNIPTRIEVGYAGTAYHAWISTYITDIGWINGIIQFNGTSWSLMDPTFAANSSESALKNFIGDGSNYKTKYIY